MSIEEVLKVGFDISEGKDVSTMIVFASRDQGRGVADELVNIIRGKEAEVLYEILTDHDLSGIRKRKIKGPLEPWQYKRLPDFTPEDAIAAAENGFYSICKDGKIAILTDNDTIDIPELGFIYDNQLALIKK